MQVIEQALQQTNRTRENKIDLSNLSSVRLYGGGGVFDSMQLVNFLVLVEQLVDDEFGQAIALTSEKAVSMRVSPFSSTTTLAAFIEGELSIANSSACA